MLDAARRNENGSGAREFDNQTQGFHVEVAAEDRIKLAARGDATQPVAEVKKVDMVERDRIRAAVEGGGGENGVVE